MELPPSPSLTLFLEIVEAEVVVLDFVLLFLKIHRGTKILEI